MNLLKVKDQDGFYRDPNSKAILINNEKDRNSYKTNKNVIGSIINNINTLENEVSGMKQDFNDIKNLLSIIIKNQQELIDVNLDSQGNRSDSRARSDS